MGQLENRFLEAATVGDVNVVKKMLADGIDVDVRNEENRTALMRCTRRGRKQVTQLLLDAGMSEALYMDMGPGWNYSWYREFPDSSVTWIHSVSLPSATNWLVFYHV